MHCHTCRSDGKEGPAIVAANYRKSGFDFLSITDHGQYEPAQEAIRAFSDIPMSFQLFAGEEVHPPKNNCQYGCILAVHTDINQIFREDPENMEREIDEMSKTNWEIPDGD